MANYYITTTIPYVNADPHIGFALEIIQADTLARYHRMLGDSVFHNFGSDEHGIKIYKKALENKKDPQAYVDEYAKKFKDLREALNLQYDSFVRTTDPHHIKAAQEFWKICDKNGDIYKKAYKVKYCVGCEMEKTDSELINGFCEFHPGLPLEIIEEENYFFKFSKYQKSLLEFYKKTPQFVVPESKYNEIKTFVEGGLQDFSISRLKAKMPWGVPVPGDDNHVMYVWFDALVNYISVLGWPDELENYKKFWPGIQTAGKDNLRQQSAIWQAMLLSAGLPNSKQIFIHGFIQSGGQRMSKSLGNVVDPIAYVKNYGTDALRYYLLAKIHPTEDSDFTEEKFKETYNADLANNLGNLVARVAKLCETANYAEMGADQPERAHIIELDEYSKALGEYRFHDAIKFVFNKVVDLNHYIDAQKPWDLIKNNSTQTEGVLAHCVDQLQEIAALLAPFLPETSEKITKQFKGPKIVPGPSLFPRVA